MRTTARSGVCLGLLALAMLPASVPPEDGENPRVFGIAKEAPRATFIWIKDRDPSRPVQYERAGLRPHADIYCPMYASIEHLDKYSSERQDRPLILCEYVHSMGNSTGNLQDY